MDILCKVCDKDIIENRSEYKNYIATIRKKDDKSIYKTYVINNINLDEVDKIINDYVSTHDKKINIYFFIANSIYNSTIFIPEIYHLHVFII